MNFSVPYFFAIPRRTVSDSASEYPQNLTRNRIISSCIVIRPEVTERNSSSSLNPVIRTFPSATSSRKLAQPGRKRPFPNENHLIYENPLLCSFAIAIVSSDMKRFKYDCAEELSHWNISVVSSRISFQTSSSSRSVLSGVNLSIPASLQVSLITPTLSSPRISSFTYISASSSFMLSIDTG